MHIPNLALAAKPGHRRALGRAGRVLVNLAGAASAALFARASLQFYLHTHLLIGVAFFAEHAWFVITFLIKRPARAVETTGRQWLLAADRKIVVLLLPHFSAQPAYGLRTGLTIP